MGARFYTVPVTNKKIKKVEHTYMKEKQINEKPKTDRKQLLIKILLFVLIIAVVAGIWIFKNSNAGKGEEKKIYNSSEFDLDATENFNLEEILSHGVPVIIDFGSDSCIPCRKMAPILAELNEEYRGKAVIKFVDVGKNPDAAEGFPLKVIPTQFFFDKNGKPYKYHEGSMDKESLVEILREMGAE